jgi:hypothetical protein
VKVRAWPANENVKAFICKYRFMLKKPQEPKSFYVGWMPRADPEYRGFVRLVIFAMIVVVIFVAVVLVTNQRGFSPGVFERRHYTGLEGMLIQHPFPAIKTFYGKDIYGNPVVKTIPLVNKGKFGADTLVARMLAEYRSQGDMLWVNIKGRLIYNRGSALMELTDQEAAIRLINDSPANHRMPPPVVHDLGAATLHGQIVDPKCYLGVMKPGEGKPHSDCAIRCIEGNIPPVLKIINDSGDETLLILRGENGETINRQILKYVGIPVSVTGKIEQVDDWLVMKTDPSSGIEAEDR